MYKKMTDTGFSYHQTLADIAYSKEITGWSSTAEYQAYSNLLKPLAEAAAATIEGITAGSKAATESQQNGLARAMAKSNTTLFDIFGDSGRTLSLDDLLKYVTYCEDKPKT